jgi:CheY-like chemotaxis protein
MHRETPQTGYNYRANRTLRPISLIVEILKVRAGTKSAKIKVPNPYNKQTIAMRQIDKKSDDIRVVVMEDYGNLCKLLNRSITLAEGMHCIGHFDTGVDTLEAMPALMPDVVLLDLTMPDINGLSVLRRLRENWPEIRAIIFSGHADESYVKSAFDLGAMGYVFKEDFDDLLGAIRTVFKGELYLSPRFSHTDTFQALTTKQS